MDAQKQTRNEVFDQMLSILTLYKYELPLCVSEYFLYLYYPYITSNIKIDFNFIKKLIKYRKDLYLTFRITSKNIIELSGINFYFKDIDTVYDTNIATELIHFSSDTKFLYFEDKDEDSLFTTINQSYLNSNYEGVLIVTF